MNRADREIYVVLTNETGSALCGACQFQGDYCEHSYCGHPLQDRLPLAESPEPNGDCWGFRPEHSLEEEADITGCIIQNGFTSWSIEPQEDGTILVRGAKE